jgi:hypothetical protein
MRTDSTTLNNTSYIMRTPSTSLPPATHSTMAKLPTSTSQSVTGSIRRRSGSALMRMEPSRAITQHRGPMNNPTSLTYMHCLTSVSIPPLKHYQTGSGICSQDWEVTSKSYSRLWLTRMIGAWPERSHVTGSSMMTSWPLPSKSSNINVTSKPPGHGLHHVSHVSCSPAPPSELPHYKTYLGRLEWYVQGGRGAVICRVASMFAPRHWRISRDVHGCPS